EEDAPSIREPVDMAAAARGAAREVGRTQEAWIARNIGDDLAAGPEVVARGDGIDAGGGELGADLVGGAEARDGGLARLPPRSRRRRSRRSPPRSRARACAAVPARAP